MSEGGIIAIILALFGLAGFAYKAGRPDFEDEAREARNDLREGEIENARDDRDLAEAEADADLRGARSGSVLSRARRVLARGRRLRGADDSGD